jgi:quinol monooxygenase YgiN
MIIEIATFSIVTDKSTEFEQAFVAARRVITQAEGCGAVAMHRSIETPGRFVLTVEWPVSRTTWKSFAARRCFRNGGAFWGRSLLWLRQLNISY